MTPDAVDLRDVWSRFDAMLADLLVRLPLAALALVAMALGWIVAARAKRVVELRERRHNLALVLGRIAQSAVGFAGAVPDVQTRATMTTTDDGQRVVSPNGKRSTQIVVVEREAS